MQHIDDLLTVIHPTPETQTIYNLIKTLKTFRTDKKIGFDAELTKTLNLIPKHFFSDNFQLISFLRESSFTKANYKDLMSQVILSADNNGGQGGSHNHAYDL